MTEPRTMESPWLTRQEAAEYLGVTGRTISRYVADGLIKHHRPGGKNLRIHRDDLDKFVKESR